MLKCCCCCGGGVAQVWDYSPNLVPIVPYEYFRDMDEANVVPGTPDEVSNPPFPPLLHHHSWHYLWYLLTYNHRS